MGWGNPLKKLWNDAKDVVKQRAADLAKTTRAALQTTVDTVERAGAAVGDAVKKGVAWVGDAVTTAGHAVSGAIAWLGDAAEGVVRNLQRYLLKGAMWIMAKFDLSVRRISDFFRRIFGGDKGGPCVDCSSEPLPRSNAEADGLYMMTDGKSTSDLDTAKADAVRPAPDFACCKGKVKEDRVIYYVNGIKTKQHDHMATLLRLAHTLCAKVVGIYNATDGFPRDAVQTATDRDLIDKAAAGGEVKLDGRNPAVDSVSRLIEQEVSAGNRVELYAHSQGGAVTSLGMYSAQNQLGKAGMANPLSGVSVTSMGSAAPQWPTGAHYDHRAHVDDWTPMGLGLPNDQLHLFDGPGKDGQFIQKGEPGYEADMLAPANNHFVDTVYIRELAAERQKQGKGGCGTKYDELLSPNDAKAA